MTEKVLLVVEFIVFLLFVREFRILSRFSDKRLFFVTALKNYFESLALDVIRQTCNKHVVLKFFEFS